MVMLYPTDGRARGGDGSLGVFLDAGEDPALDAQAGEQEEERADDHGGPAEHDHPRVRPAVEPEQRARGGAPAQRPVKCHP